jgi:hypothetical protein
MRCGELPCGHREYYRFPTCDLGGSAEDEWAACRLRGHGMAGCLHGREHSRCGVVCLYDDWTMTREQQRRLRHSRVTVAFAA